MVAELESNHKSQLEMLNQNSIKHMAALKMEMQRAAELTKRKVMIMVTGKSNTQWYCNTQWWQAGSYYGSQPVNPVYFEVEM